MAGQGRPRPQQPSGPGPGPGSGPFVVCDSFFFAPSHPLASLSRLFSACRRDVRRDRIAVPLRKCGVPSSLCLCLPTPASSTPFPMHSTEPPPPCLAAGPITGWFFVLAPFGITARLFMSAVLFASVSLCFPPKTVEVCVCVACRRTAVRHARMQAGRGRRTVAKCRAGPPSLSQSI